MNHENNKSLTGPTRHLANNSSIIRLTTESTTWQSGDLYYKELDNMR